MKYVGSTAQATVLKFEKFSFGQIKMEIEKSRNGFYTLTFINKNHMHTEDIFKEFSTVGNVANVVQNYQRVFVRFTEKEEAERAINKFGKVYDVSIAKNKSSENLNSEVGINHNSCHKNSHNHAAPPSVKIANVSESMEKLNSNNKIFHLILGNLPQNYTIKDVNDLVAEAKPVSISQLDETRVFNIKFCHIVLDSTENLTYLIDKLNGFVICGEKLIAAEARHLLEWKEKARKNESRFEIKTEYSEPKWKKKVPKTENFLIYDTRQFILNRSLGAMLLRLNCLRMATRTSTETKREITRRGDVVIIKEVEITTIHAPGKEPEVKEVTRVEEFKGEEGFKRIPEDIRRQLEKPNSQREVKPLNKNATRGNFAEDCLKEHNKYRSAHGTQPLELSKELIEVSEKRARELAEKDEMSSRKDHTYGENLSCMWSSDPEHFVEAPEIVARWYSEEKNYDYQDEPKDLNAGHFTQMIWAGSKEFGAAAAKSDSNKIYVVATYSPPGNYVGEFKNNVHPAGSKSRIRNFFGLKPFRSSGMEEAKKSGSSSAASEGDLNKECVKIHNEYRAKHGVPPLTFSQEVANHAQEWADELARKDKFEHRSSRKYGENLYSFMSSDPSVLASAADACNTWYAEIKDFKFDVEPKTLAAGHFTQMIWKETKEVGMGRAKSKKGMQIIVANYNPPGNFVGKFVENVPKAIA